MTSPRFRWRRLLQFRIRTLLILIAVLAVLLGWWSYRANRQRQAVAALKRAGAYVSHTPTPSWIFSPPGPEWMMDSSWRDYFTNVRTVWFVVTPSDGDVEQLKKLHSLEDVLVPSLTPEDELKRLRAALPGRQVSDIVEPSY